MHQIVVGCGETGAPLATLLEERFGKAIFRHDPAKGWSADHAGYVDALHVCLPWSERFVEQLYEYALRWQPQGVIIHSTVPVGTTREVRKRVRAVHSPIRGMHDTMLNDLKTYPKYVGYDDADDVAWVARAFQDIFEVCPVKDSRSTELAKLLELSRYGLMLAFAREQDALCRGLGLDYQHVVREFVESHNKGMDARKTPRLRQQDVTPPDGPLGGHCVLPGMRLVCEQFQPALLSRAYALERAVEGGNATAGLYVHASAVVSPNATVGKGTKIWHFAHVREGARIGEDCVIGQGCYVAEGAVIGHRVHVQNGVSVYTGVTIEDDAFIGPHVVFTNDLYPPSGTVTPTRVGKGASIGAGAVNVCGVTIHAGAKVGAGAVVTKDVAPGEWWVGNPARELHAVH